MMGSGRREKTRLRKIWWGGTREWPGCVGLLYGSVGGSMETKRMGGEAYMRKLEAK